jgi:hypothetical protein
MELEERHTRRGDETGEPRFASVFFKILSQLPSIYRGFRLRISCVCRVLCPSSQIRPGFDNSFDFVEILAGGISISVMTQRRVGDDRR